MHKNGGRLCELLEAGDWRSSAFMKYLDQADLEHDAVHEAHDVMLDVFDESSGDEAEC